MDTDALFSTSMVNELRAFAAAAARRLRLPQEAGEDACQEALLRLWRDPDLVRWAVHPGYARRMMKNLLLDVVRSFRQRETALEECSPMGRDDGSALARLEAGDAQRELEKLLDRALDRLEGARKASMRCWVSMVRTSDDEVPFRLVAERLGVSIATVSRARDELQRALVAEGVEAVYTVPVEGRRRYQRRRRR